MRQVTRLKNLQIRTQKAAIWKHSTEKFEVKNSKTEIYHKNDFCSLSSRLPSHKPTCQAVTPPNSL